MRRRSTESEPVPVATTLERQELNAPGSGKESLERPEAIHTLGVRKVCLPPDLEEVRDAE